MALGTDTHVVTSMPGSAERALLVQFNLLTVFIRAAMAVLDTATTSTNVTLMDLTIKTMQGVGGNTITNP